MTFSDVRRFLQRPFCGLIIVTLTSGVLISITLLKGSHNDAISSSSDSSIRETYLLTEDEVNALNKYRSSGVASLSAPEMVLAAFAQFKEHDNAMTISEGSAVGRTTVLFMPVAITQTIRSSWVHHQNQYFLEANSYSSDGFGKKVGHRGYRDDQAIDSEISVEGNSNDGAETASWAYPGTACTASIYASTYGKSVMEPCIYDINDSTASGTVEGTGPYTVSLEVNETGWSHYRIQIAQYGGVTYRSQSSCSLTFSLTSSLELTQCLVDEIYVVNSTFDATVTNQLKTRYFYNDSDVAYPIPRDVSSGLDAPADFPYSTYWLS